VRILSFFAGRDCVFACGFLALAIVLPCWAQEPTPPQTPAPTSSSAPEHPEQPAATTSATAAAASSGPAARLLLGAGDEGEVSVYGVPDLAQKFRVDPSGMISLPLIGLVKVAGLTAEEAQAAIEKSYSDGGYLRNPHITVSVKNYTTQGITVLGEVVHPGTYSAMNVRRLFDAFLAAGGLTQRAGNAISINRAKENGRVETIELTNDPEKSAKNNVSIDPGDTVIVGRAGIVYVLGEVTRPGGFVIDNPEGRMTLTQAFAMAAGPTHLSNLSKINILRHTPAGLEKQELDIRKVLAAKANDIPLQAEDIVFIPASRGKMAAERGASSILSMVANLAIYRF
jgi:polysaccharide export outer membrane protein